MTAAGFTLTNPGRLLWPEEGITKGDLAAYYERVAPVLLPHLQDRPLVMRPIPAGIGGRSFYRQNLPKTAPAWLPRFTHVAAVDRQPNAMPVAGSLPALRWLVNQAAIEMHPWLSRVDQPDQPDFVVFDLDIVRPALFARVLKVALLLRLELARLGLTGYPKTSGGDGLHVYVPITRGPSFGQTHAFALALAERLAATEPDLISTDPRPSHRAAQVLVDYAQNARGHTTVAAYSVRPRPGAPVSTPLTWDEVERGRVRPGAFTMQTVPERLAALGDLFAPVLRGGQPLPAEVDAGTLG